MLKYFDKYWIGIVLGLVVTALFGYFYMQQMGLLASVFLYGFRAVVPKLIIVALFPNLALLFVFYQLSCWKIAKGIVFSMIPYLALATIQIILYN